MSNQITIHDEPKALERPLTTIEMLSDAARKSGTAEAVQLFELLRLAENREAEKEFIAAFARLDFPPIKKLAKGQNSTKYAAWDQVQDIITPILKTHGFTLSFGSGHITDKGMVPIEATLSHIGGHKETRFLELPMDKSGQMTAIQGGGSTFSYGKRYAAGMILNLRFVSEDDDGGAHAAITQEQVDAIDAMIAENELGDVYRSNLLTTLNVKSLAELQKVQYPTAINLIRAKLRAKTEKAK